MKQINILFFAAFVVLTFSASAQSNSKIKNTHGFYIYKQPGNIMVDGNGKEIANRNDTALLVYVETSTKNIKWYTGWFNGNSYNILVQDISNTSISAGTVKSTGKDTTVKIKKGNFLWQLNLMPSEKKYNAEVSKATISRPGVIVLAGKYKGIAFFCKTGRPVELEAIPSM